MPGRGRQMLMLGGVLVACVSIFHLACGIVGPPAYRYFGGEAMAKAASGSPWLTVLTFGLAVVFGFSALYGFSAAGRVRPLPLARVAIIFTGVIFGLRGLFLVPELMASARAADTVPVRNLFYSAVALLIGLLYLLGLAFSGKRSPGGGVYP